MSLCQPSERVFAPRPAPAPRPWRKLALATHDGHSNGPLGYLEMGRSDGPCVVFIHGFGADLLTWQLCLVPLASKYRVIAIDLPGHGRSTLDVGDGTLAFMTEWLAEAFACLDIAAAHVVGHSMGAKIALSFALSHPDKLLRLALIAPAGLGGTFHHAALDRLLDEPDADGAEAVARQLLGPKSQHLIAGVSRSLMDAAAEPDRNRALRTLLSQTKVQGLPQSGESFDWNLIRCPLLVLWGNHDRIIPLPDHHRLPRSSAVRLLDGIGHLPQMEASQAVVTALKEFLP